MKLLAYCIAVPLQVAVITGAMVVMTAAYVVEWSFRKSEI